MKHSGVKSFFMTTLMYEIDAFKPNTWKQWLLLQNHTSKQTKNDLDDLLIAWINRYTRWCIILQKEMRFNWGRKCRSLFKIVFLLSLLFISTTACISNCHFITILTLVLTSRPSSCLNHSTSAYICHTNASEPDIYV